MNRDGHKYVKPAGSTTGPTQLVVAVPTVRPAPGHTGKRLTLWAGDSVHVAYSRRRGLNWSRPELQEGLVPSAFWDWIDSRLYDRGRLWVVAPRASDLLTLAGFWDECDRDRYQVAQKQDARQPAPEPGGKGPKQWFGRLVMAGGTDIITARQTTRALTFLSLTNYTGATIDELAAWAGIETTGPDPNLITLGLPWHNPLDVRAVILGTLQRMISQWVKDDCGPWRETVGQLVISLWRRRFLSVKVCRHTDDEASELERGALHGGRATCWYFGRVGDPGRLPAPAAPPPKPRWSLSVETQANHVDVTSMYPAILRDGFFPTRLLNVYSDLTVKNLSEIAAHRAVIATVDARTRVPEYPYFLDRRIVYRWPDGGRPIKKRSHVSEGRVIYPVGFCRLTLAGPELLQLASEGGIVRVIRAAVYDAGQPFKELCTYLLDRRGEARDLGDKFLEGWCKQLNNSFAGKFAQRGDRWEPVTEPVEGPRWGEWRLVDDATESVRRFRSLAGHTSELITGPPGRKLLAAVFAYLTGYGRLLMRSFRDRLPARSCVAQDTDGLWLTDAGLTALGIGTQLGTPCPGTLRLVRRHSSVQFLTPKHYWRDGSWVLSGFESGFRIVRGSLIASTQTVNPIRFAPKMAPALVGLSESQVSIASIGPSEFIDREGWSVAAALRPDGTVTRDPRWLPPPDLPPVRQPCFPFFDSQ